MIVIADGDAGAGADVVVDHFVEQAVGARVGVPLQIAPHPVVAVAEPLGVKAALRIQQQPRGFNRPSAHHHQFRRLFPQAIVRVEIGDARHLPAIAHQDFLDHRFRAQLAVTCGQRHRDDGVLRAALRVHLAGESHAPAAAHAGFAASVGHAVAQHRDVERMQAQAQGRGLQDGLLARRRKRRHGQRLAPRRFERVRPVVARNADFPLRLLVVRLQIGVGDGPVFERAAGHRAVGRAQVEIALHKPPGHRAVTERAAAHAGGVVLILALAGAHDALPAVAAHHHARVALVVRSGRVAQRAVALVAQVVLAAVERRVPLAALQQHHAQPRHGQLFGDNAAPGARAHHHGVHLFQAHGILFGFHRPRMGIVGTPSILQLTAPALPPCRGSP